jgi:CheY-like chemotaxis protein
MKVLCRSGVNWIRGMNTRKRILCIEDDRETADLIAEELDERGYEVCLAHDGQAGYSKIVNMAPDLVLCDISMPVVTGFELPERLTAAAPRFGTRRPDNNQPPENSMIHRFLELNLTSESFDFQVIPGVVPNRGFDTQADLSLYGLHYLQRVSDADPAPSPSVNPQGYSQTAGQALHIEPGLFMNVPGSQANNNLATIVRMASIPHGVTVLMQGPTPATTPTPGLPKIYPPGTPLQSLLARFATSCIS